MARAALALIVLGAAAVLGYAARRALQPSSADAGLSPSLLAPVTQAADLLEQLGQQVIAAGRKLFELPQSAQQYAEHIRQAEQQHGLPQSLLGRVLFQESRFRPDIINGSTRSPVGAVGIAQFMPATAAELGVNPLDPFQSIDGAARYLRKLFDRFGNWPEALAAYNWGQGNVARKGLENAPRETRDYLTQILSDVEV